MYSFSHFNCKLYIFYCQTLLSLPHIDPVDNQNCVFNKTYCRDFSCLYELQWGGRERSLNHSPYSGFVDWIHLFKKKGSFFPWNSLPHHHTPVIEKTVNFFVYFIHSFLSKDMWYIHRLRILKIYDSLNNEKLCILIFFVFNIHL